jgi:hypothetical protein
MPRLFALLVAGLVAAGTALTAADATTPIDYTRRNDPFAPGSGPQPAKKAPATNDAVQQKRVAPPTVDKPAAAVGDRRARVPIAETNPKNVQDKTVRPNEKIDPTRSGYDGQRSRYSTVGDTTKPPTVAKYQDSLAAASASNMARFPALDQATAAKVNRFVFRRNGGDLADSATRAGVVPAAGGSAPSR